MKISLHQIPFQDLLGDEASACMPPLPAGFYLLSSGWFSGLFVVALLLTVPLLLLHHLIPFRVVKYVDALALAHKTHNGEPVVCRYTSYGAAVTIAVAIWGVVRLFSFTLPLSFLLFAIRSNMDAMLPFIVLY